MAVCLPRRSPSPRAFRIKNSPAVAAGYLVSSAAIRSRELRFDEAAFVFGCDAALFLAARGGEQITGRSHKQDSNLIVKLLYHRKGD